LESTGLGLGATITHSCCSHIPVRRKCQTSGLAYLCTAVLYIEWPLFDSAKRPIQQEAAWKCSHTSSALFYPSDRLYFIIHIKVQEYHIESGQDTSRDVSCELLTAAARPLVQAVYVAFMVDEMALGMRKCLLWVNLPSFDRSSIYGCGKWAR
jgi:hypothetical protein